MKRIRLGDVADVEISGIDKKTKDSEKAVKLCNFVDVYYNWAITKYMYDDLMTASASDSDIETFILRKGQVAITKDSETRDDIGVAAYIADDFDDVVLGYHCALITPKGDIPEEDRIDGKYLNAILHTKYAQKHFSNNATGSGQRYTLSKEAVEDMILYLPSPKEQERIGNYLSEIDHKIELNYLINEKLEDLAKQIYDYWFVQFDFPNKDGKPYKSSGGKMVWNETLKREIPEGWEVSSYGKEFMVKLGGTPSTEIPEYWENGSFHWMNSGEVQLFPVSDTEKKITQDAITNSSTELLPKKSVLISITRHLRVTILGIDACINQSVVGFSESDKLKCPYTYFALKREVPRLMNLRTGAQQPHINKETVECSPIILPGDNILGKYYLLTENMFDNILIVGKEILYLEKLRNYLLPLLMNGQVTIKD